MPDEQVYVFSDIELIVWYPKVPMVEVPRKKIDYTLSTTATFAFQVIAFSGAPANYYVSYPLQGALGQTPEQGDVKMHASSVMVSRVSALHE